MSRGATTYTNTPTGIVPAGQAPGDYYVIAYTDQAAFLKETNETNNTRVSVTRVTLLPLPDLAPTALTEPTTPVGPNQDGSYDIPVSFTVADQGAGPAQAYWWDSIYLSVDAVLDGADTDIRDIVRNTAVLAGASYSQSATIRTPTLAAGDYYVILKTDNYSYVVETNESNNTLASTTRVTLGPRPDLVPTALTVPTAPVPRNTDGTYDIPVSFTVANQGGSDAKPYWWDSLYLSADALLGGADTNIRDISRVTAVLAGASYSQSATIRTGVLSPGNYYVILKTDNYSNLLEANEGNNVLVSATRITLAP
jgi:subtilase family serine protease